MLTKFLFLSCCILGVVIGQNDPDAPKPDPDAPKINPDAPKNAPSDCGNVGIDLVFVIDASGSVGQDNFNKMITAVRNTVKNLDVGPGDDQTHVGVVTFDDKAVTRFGLDEHLTQADLDDALSKIPYTSGGTQIAPGMLAGIDVFFPSDQPASGNRPNVPDVMVVITDGEDTTDTRSAHQAAEDKGITVFAVGVGNSQNLDMNQLEVIAGGPDKVFVSTDFTFLDSVLREKVCAGIVDAVQAQATTMAATTTTTTTPRPSTTEETQTTTQDTTIKCGVNEIFDGCGGCEASCGSFNNTCLQNCDTKNARCRCQTGFVRDSNGRCVTPDDCCGFGEVFDACGGCEEKCGARRLDCIDGCDFEHARCRCRRGIARDEMGLCVARDGCSSRQPAMDLPCGANEIRRCSTSCEGTCGNRRPDCIFNAPVRPRCRFQRCECPVENGFIRDHFGRCIHKSLCPDGRPSFDRPSFSGRPFGRPHFHGHFHSSSESESNEHGQSGNGNSGLQNPNMNGQNSGMGNQNSGMGNQNSGMGNQNSGMGNQNSGMGNQNSGMGNQNSGMDNQNSGMGNQSSGNSGQTSGSGNQPGSGQSNPSNGNQNPGSNGQIQGNGGQNVQLDDPNAQRPSGNVGPTPLDGSSGSNQNQGGSGSQGSVSDTDRPVKIIIINKTFDGGNGGAQSGGNRPLENSNDDDLRELCRSHQCQTGSTCNVHCSDNICRPSCDQDTQK